jgi:hypothetical protein
VLLAARRWRHRRQTAVSGPSSNGEPDGLEPDQEQRLAAELAAFDR